MRVQLGFVAESTRYSANSEPFDELSARIFVPVYFRTIQKIGP